MALSRKPVQRSGRRPGDAQTRTAIIGAARQAFAAAGYDRATIRGIAAAAAVDPALVAHYFSSKEQLFHDVMQLPPGATDRILQVGEGPRHSIGRRLAEVVVGLLENPDARDVFLGRIRAASSHAAAAELVRQTVERDLSRLAASLDVDQPELRATLTGSIVIGTAFARYVVGVEPLASLDSRALVAALAPQLQQSLTGRINEDSP
jgi:AcrR family transcriptional regulator